MSLKEQIFKKAGGGKLRQIPEWGVTVLLRGMSTSMRLRVVEGRKTGALSTEQMMQDALRYGLREPDEPHAPIFSDVEIARLMDEDAQGVSEALLGEILELSGVTKESLEEAKRLFFEAQSAGSSSSTPSGSAGPLTSSSPEEEGPSPAESSPSGLPSARSRPKSKGA